MIVDTDFGVVRGKAARLLGEDVLPVPGGKAAALLGLESPQTSPKTVRFFRYKAQLAKDYASDESTEDVDDFDDEGDNETVQDDDSIIHLPSLPLRTLKSPGWQPGSCPSPSDPRPPPLPAPLIGLGLPSTRQPDYKPPSDDLKHCRHASGWTVDSVSFDHFVLPSDFYDESDHDARNVRPFSPESPRMSVLSSVETAGADLTPDSSPVGRQCLLATPRAALMDMPLTPPTQSPMLFKRTNTVKSRASWRTKSTGREEALSVLEGHRRPLVSSVSATFPNSVTDSQLIIIEGRKTRKRPASLKTPSPTKSIWSAKSIEKGIGCSFLSYSDSDETGSEEPDIEPRFQAPFWNVKTDRQTTSVATDTDSDPGSPLDPFFSSSAYSSRRPTTSTLTPINYANQDQARSCRSVLPPSPSLTITEPPRVNDNQTEEDQVTRGLRLSLASWLVPSQSSSRSASSRQEARLSTSLTSIDSSSEEEDHCTQERDEGKSLMMSFPNPPAKF
ncbi:hypothetical protein OIV83_003775 [Microbotryomycetes sp. JL201]|nr:hypothetical protein OIV83_003775 [Microbotryomycetes sp. JL201]